MRFAFWIGCALALSGAWGCTSPIVGAQCRNGLTACGAVCVDVLSDPAHCGGCDRACAGDQLCSAGACVGGGYDAGAPDAQLGWAPGDDAGAAAADGGVPSSDASATPPRTTEARSRRLAATWASSSATGGAFARTPIRRAAAGAG